MATVLITGGTGLIGAALSKALMDKGFSVCILTRQAKPSQGGTSYKQWNIADQTIDESAIREADYIIHLAGANVADGRWTAKRKKEIVDSRVQSGRLLIKALKATPNKVQAVFSASAIGWYGADPEVPNPKPFVEADDADKSFLGQTCMQWEAAIEPVKELGKRLVIFRTGIVLSNKGGAYAEFKKPLNFSAATILGNGKQVVSWIHVDDMVRLYIEAIENEAWQGIYNAVVPAPVTNKQLIIEMAKQRAKVYIPLHVPSFALKIALGEMSVEVLKSATVSAKKIEEAGFEFTYPTIEKAIKQLRTSRSIYKII